MKNQYRVIIQGPSGAERALLAEQINQLLCFNLRKVVKFYKMSTKPEGPLPEHVDVVIYESLGDEP